MKLKRFLLRYEPPGVGLETDDGSGELDVRHKDLPPAEECSTVEDIGRRVDELIASEPTLLTRRRHRRALLQLLGRLYQVDVEGALNEEEEPSPKGKQASSAAAPKDEPATLREGQQVVLIGLKGEKQVYNGEIGTLTKVREDKEKYEVLFPAVRDKEEETIKVKGGEHICVVAKGAVLAVGVHVAIRGLRNHIELNGCLGRVVECHVESHRYEVRATESGQLFRVKQENLVPIEGAPPQVANSHASKENREPGNQGKAEDGAGGAAEGDDVTLEPGATVQLIGLKTAMAFNGQQAEVLSVDRARRRYEIRLTDGSVKTIRAENVRLVAAAPGKSPRGKKKNK